MIKIGVIADDFTGRDGYRQFSGGKTVYQRYKLTVFQQGKMPEAIDALVISLKTRSCPVVEAHSNRWRL